MPTSAVSSGSNPTMPPLSSNPTACCPPGPQYYYDPTSPVVWMCVPGPAAPSAASALGPEEVPQMNQQEGAARIIRGSSAGGMTVTRGEA